MLKTRSPRIKFVYQDREHPEMPPHVLNKLYTRSQTTFLIIRIYPSERHGGEEYRTYLANIVLDPITRQPKFCRVEDLHFEELIGPKRILAWAAVTDINNAVRAAEPNTSYTGLAKTGRRYYWESHSGHGNLQARTDKHALQQLLDQVTDPTVLYTKSLKGPDTYRIVKKF